MQQAKDRLAAGSSGPRLPRVRDQRGHGHGRRQCPSRSAPRPPPDPRPRPGRLDASRAAALVRFTAVRRWGAPSKTFPGLSGTAGINVTELVYRHQIRPVIQTGATIMDRLRTGKLGCVVTQLVTQWAGGAWPVTHKCALTRPSVVGVTGFEPATSRPELRAIVLGTSSYAQSDAHGRERTHGGAMLLLYFAAVLIFRSVGPGRPSESTRECDPRRQSGDTGQCRGISIQMTPKASTAQVLAVRLDTVE